VCLVRAHWVLLFVCFFFQAEDGIRDRNVTGVQTCALPILGLFVGGWLHITALMKERRFQSTQKRAGYLGTFFVGMGFAAGWTPCIGPIFGSILLLAATNPGQGVF